MSRSAERFSPWVTSPGNAGHVTTNPPSGSGSKTNVYVRLVIATLRLRLRRDLTARRIGPRAALAGRRHCGGARRDRLAHPFTHRRLAVEQVLDLVARERLVFEQ